MKQVILILIITIFFAMPVFSNPDPDSEVIPEGIRNNEYYLDSLRLQKLAQEAYDYGDYETSARIAQEAIRSAELSDKYIASQLIPEAKRLLEWADDNNIESKFPNNYNEGLNQYETSIEAYTDESWHDSVIAAVKAIEIFGAFEGSIKPSSTGTAPRQYKVRTWRVEKDCFWNIAGYPWVYNDPWKWKILYEANKSKIPDPENPNLIEPGMILDIPNLKGEARQGMFNP